MTRHRAWAVAVLVVVAACSPFVSEAYPPASPDSETVVLLTGDLEPVGCPAAVVEGQLIRDVSAGSAIAVGDIVMRVRWPSGYSGRKAADQVEILDPGGRVVARTGTRVRLGGGEIETGIWLACADPVTL